MGWQLIFTSAPRTLSAGQSGYGTVARSRDLRDALIQRLEQLSYYTHASGSERTPSTALPPVVCAYRILDVRGTKYHVLSRIQDAGLDFTNRTNHLAHHLVFASTELPTLPSPALIFQRWNGWRANWREEPRLLEDSDWGNLGGLPRSVPLPAQQWQRTTGDAGSAAALLERAVVSGCLVVSEPGRETQLLPLFAESLQLLDPFGKTPAKLWQTPFTTCLQAEDNPLDFCWRGCGEGSPSWVAAQRGGTSPILVPAVVRAPAGALAQLAREGPPLPVPKAPIPAGVPGQSAASPAGKTPLRSPVPLTLRGADAGELNAPSRRVFPRRGEFTFHLNLTSPRVLWPTLGVTVLLLLVLAWFFTPWGRQRVGSQPVKKTPPLAAQTSNAPPPRSGDVTIQETAPAASKKKGTKKGPGRVEKAPPPAPPPPSASALEEQLRQRFDTLGVPTYWVPCQRDQANPLPNQEELSELLFKFFVETLPLSPDDAPCFADAETYELGWLKSERLKLKVVTTGQKQLIGLNETGQEVFTLSATEWARDRKIRPTIQLGVQIDGVLQIRFRPVPKGMEFPAFRLVLALGKATPMRLSKALLLAERSSLEESFLEPLNRRWQKLYRDEGVHAQLRPAAKANAQVDLIEKLGREFVPVPGEELGFAKLSQAIQEKLTVQHDKKAALDKQLANLETQIGTDNRADLEIGQLLGFKQKEWRSLAAHAHAGGKEKEINRQLFLAYLRGLLSSTKLDKDGAALVPAPGTPHAEMLASLSRLHPTLVAAGFQKELETVPPDYFAKRWQELGLVETKHDYRRQIEVIEKEISRLNALLALVPANLAECPSVSLVLKAPDGPRIEFIQFVESP